MFFLGRGSLIQQSLSLLTLMPLEAGVGGDHGVGVLFTFLCLCYVCCSCERVQSVPTVGF